MADADPQERVYSYYLVALADVLGQKDVFEECLAGLPPFNSETHALYLSKLEEAHAGTVEVVDEIDGDLRDFYEVLRSRLERSTLPEALRKMNQFTLTYRPFADSFLTYSPFFHVPNMEYLFPSIVSAFYAISTYGYLMLASLSRERPVRGAIEIGFATEICRSESEGREIYGPIRYEAYKLESDTARYPRIVVGQKLREFLEATIRGRVAVHGMGEHDLRASKSAASRCLRMITEDVDGVYMVDYLGGLFEEALGTETMGGLCRQAYSFVEREHSKWTQRGDDKLAKRYRSLMEYWQRSTRVT